MNVSKLIKHGYLEDTKEGYVVKKNFSSMDNFNLNADVISYSLKSSLVNLN